MATTLTLARVEEPEKHPVGVRRRAEEPQTDVVALEIVVERVQRGGVGRLGAAERHDGAVTQDVFVDHAGDARRALPEGASVIHHGGVRGSPPSRKATDDGAEFARMVGVGNGGTIDLVPPSGAWTDLPLPLVKEPHDESRPPGRL